jgi:hypothetical protein
MKSPSKQRLEMGNKQDVTYTNIGNDGLPNSSKGVGRDYSQKPDFYDMIGQEATRGGGV